MKDLITIETLKAADVFKPGAVEKLVAEVEAKVRAIPAADHTTEKGRNEIKALAYKITRSKTALDDMGKTFVAELKKAAGIVDADRRIIRERLEALKDDVRKPVDAYEAAEELRKETHIRQLERLQQLGTFSGTATSNEIKARQVELRQFGMREWEEFSDSAKYAMKKLDESLTAMYADASKRQAEQAELERLRKAVAERQEAERKANTAREQRERDKQIADIARREIEAVAQARENERLAAVARAERAEADAKEFVARAERDKFIAAEQAEQDRRVAIAAERKRAEDAKAAEDEASRKREANRSWRAKVKKKAVAALVEAGLSAQYAELAFNAIDRGEVPGISIQY